MYRSYAFFRKICVSHNIKKKSLKMSIIKFNFFDFYELSFFMLNRVMIIFKEGGMGRHINLVLLSVVQIG